MRTSLPITAFLALVAFGPVNSAVAFDDPPAKKDLPPRPLAELARDLKDPDRQKRYAAAVAINEHYEGRCVEVLPQIMDALAIELAVPQSPTPRHPGMTHLLRASLLNASVRAGPGKLEFAKQYAQSNDPFKVAAALPIWGAAISTKDEGTDADAFIVIVRQCLKNSNRTVRCNALAALLGFCDNIPHGNTDKYPIRVTDIVVRLLADALNDQEVARKGFNAIDDNPAVTAAWALGRFRAKAKPAMHNLARMASTSDSSLVHSSCTALQQIAEHDLTAAEDVVKVLRPLLADKQRSDELRCFAAYGLCDIGPAARLAIPELTEIIDNQLSTATLRIAAYSTLSSLKSHAVDAIPSLILRLEKSRDKQELIKILCTIKSVGPAAASAIQSIEKWMANTTDVQLEGYAIETIDAIRK